MDVTKKGIWFLLLLMFSLCEMWMWGTHHNRYGIFFSPVWFFLSSFGVSVVVLVASYYLTEVGQSDKKYSSRWLILAYIPALVWLVFIGWKAFSIHPVDYNDSDIFAQVLSPSQWLLGGQYPYQDVVLPTYTMHNTYLPMQWLPFLLPVYFHFDPRWVPVVAWVLVLGLFFWDQLSSFDRKKGISWLVWVIAGYLSVRSMFEFIQFHAFDYTVSLEMLPAAYYVLFILAVLRGSWFWMGFTLACCLMSRFSIVLLSPFLAYYVWQRYGFTTLWKSTSVVMATVLVLFVLPFMTKDPSLPVKILGNYDSGAAGEWQTHSWQEPGSEPHQLARGFGLAIFVKKMYEYDIQDGIHHLKQLSIFLSIMTGFFLIYLYWRNKNHLNRDWLFLGGLKLYFTFFYHFVLIPYPYLFVLPLTVTAVCLVKAASDFSASVHWQSSKITAS